MSAPRAACWGPRGLVAALLGLAAALLISCGSSGKGLIPTADAGPLQSDFEAVSQAALSGNGSCSATEAAIAKTEQDFNALPAGVDGGLRSRLREGITNLSKRARELCAQPLTPATTATTQKTTPPATTTTTETSTTPTTTTPTGTATTPATTPTETGGGTAAPGETPGNGNGNGNGKGGEERSGGVGAEGESK